MVDQGPLLLYMLDDGVDERVALLSQREATIEVLVSTYVLLEEVQFALLSSSTFLMNAFNRLYHAQLEQGLQEVALACCSVQPDLCVRWRCQIQASVHVKHGVKAMLSSTADVCRPHHRVHALHQ